MKKLIPFILSLFCRFIRLTNRFKFHQLENVEEAKKLSEDGNYALASWHQNLFACILALRHPLISMASRSKDGEIAAKTAEHLGIVVTRGSSSRGGKEAMMEMIKAAKKLKHPVALTVDGPRGPAHEPKKGLFKIAYDIKAPIVPYMAVSSNTKVFEKSWDKFRFPKPFGTIHVFYGKPIMIEELNDESLDRYAEELKKEMDIIEEKLFKLL